MVLPMLLTMLMLVSCSFAKKSLSCQLFLYGRSLAYLSRRTTYHVSLKLCRKAGDFNTLSILFPYLHRCDLHSRPIMYGTKD